MRRVRFAPSPTGSLHVGNALSAVANREFGEWMLLRIDDTLGEVTRNLNSLKRQASKARKHKDLIDELSTAKRALYKGRIVAAEAEHREADDRCGAQGCH